MTRDELLKQVAKLEKIIHAKENAIHVLKMQNLDLHLKLEKYITKNKRKKYKQI